MNEPIYNEYSKKDIIPILQTALEDGIISADKKRPTLSFQKHYRRISAYSHLRWRHHEDKITVSTTVYNFPDTKMPGKHWFF